ncbi:hypothetical protein EsHS_00006007 [Epichloe bromicola]
MAIWRHDGPWMHKDLEPTANDGKTIKHERDSKGNIVRQSGIRYSCDEFPPATWVEGGNGNAVSGNVPWGGNSLTRCAAIRCAVGVKAEQDWQGSAHGRLRETLSNLIDRRNAANTANKPYPYFDDNDSIVFFNFRMTNDPHSGVAAKIYTYTDPSLSTVKDLIGISQSKRALKQESFLDWANTVTMDELVKMNNVSQYLIFTNQTEYRDPGVSSQLNFDSEFNFDGNISDNGTLAAGEDSGTDSRADAVRGNHSTMGASSRNMASSIKNYAINNPGKSVVTSHAGIRKSGTEIHPSNSTAFVGNSTSELYRARQIVKLAMKKSIRLNEARLSNPRRNHYGSNPGSTAGKRSLAESLISATESHPLLTITEEIADAAALVSEADALHDREKLTKRDTAAGTYWMEHISRKGTVPWGDDPNYKVFRNVRDYGAVGDGKTDDTKAIKRALNAGRRCGEKCNGSTTKNAIIYFPPGRYRVSSSIPLPFGTQVIGDANNWPTIVAAPEFIGLGVLSTDEYTGGGSGIDGGDQQWYVNTANFYRQIRNLRIDITATRSDQQVACLHYQVAQATSIQNVELIAAPGSSQRGIFAENGSGGVISDITFRGGKFGIYGGNQQFTAQRLTFDGCATGVQVIWDWGWLWKSITMKNVNVGFRLLQESKSGHIGSASVIDSTFQNVDTAILVAPINSKAGSGSTGVIVENVEFQNVNKAVADTAGAVLLAPAAKVKHWAVGPVYSASGKREFSHGRADQGSFYRQSTLLDSKGSYFERPKPQYEGAGVGELLHVKDFGARGDGTTDDTAAFQGALYASQGKILFVDAGSYILTRTLIVPAGSRIVGETWSQLVASGSYFGDASNPKVMIKVGQEGDEGDVEMQDLLFTNRGPTAGLVLVEWNIKAAQPGSAALWDCHVRIGGAAGTELTPKECPPSTSGVNPGCNAGSLMMHITPKASGYFENMWLWVADHMIDDPDLQDANNTMVQTSVYVARGLLIESTEPVWLYGTASEHAVYYQYNFHSARNIFAGMIQTESPYYQPTPPPPSPFEKQVGLFPSDPDYNCRGNNELSGHGTVQSDDKWALVLIKQTVDGQACQKAMMLLDNNKYNVRVQQLITIGAKFMAVQNGVGIPALDNLNVDSHPRWSQVSVFYVSTSHAGSDNDVWVDRKIWRMQNPGFTCKAPCTAVLPPWTAATTTIDYPPVTVSSGTWTSTITRPPMTVSEWVFRKITVGSNDLQARQAKPSEVAVWPTLEPTKGWPGLTYLGPDGKYTTITPTAKTPPALPTTFGPNGPSPLAGDWPKAPVTVTLLDDTEAGPFADKCSYRNQQGYCDLNLDYWPIIEMIVFPDGRNRLYDERGPEDRSPCAAVPRTTSRAPTPKPTPKPRPKAHPNPRENILACYSTGTKHMHKELDSGIESFCRKVRYLMRSQNTLVGPFNFKHNEKVGYNTRPRAFWGTRLEDKYVKFGLLVPSNCEWAWSMDDCSRYYRAVVDGCNCASVDGKQGGMVSNNCVEATIYATDSKSSRHDEV